ncbi:hypothetical protein COX59_03190 [Candidatus Beckwithbacteria bacterium CG_4_10_14_0_2_um_filter_47_25]|uniref:Uncharacterized protein n=3 Tax=Candidatus Beckwithiibacteriota TaxID=1752726 RepID=A0A2H0B351_9BACT|nr:MAG: hypothetical protein COX09_03560 [Candidatus Beckwithbacteria bacterium CG23_combo_of_CG06-09_8_20_14_all_47_9]PJA22233.1 MAG: hypothetical protein COX59_03190 [Candidatus Beckwithbacteria bacterium CG_4_10_14_0_2_um_filter_47_25]PJC66009.1 MAG: hypothetical protein CO018_04180 [Candidatus Beckwithbacteria bacterium CG_4_9_14_0_2_um_filter_47_11]
MNKSFKNKLIKAVAGFRRSGKSYLLKMLAQFLLEQKVPKENIFYLNFENDLLSGVKTVHDLRKVWELYLREKAIPSEPIYIIWDEIQLVESWEKLVRTLYEIGKYNLYISGSNSKLLSGELSSSLSGRCLELYISPFSFSEYLKYLKLDADNYYPNKAQIDQAFMNYLRRGGLAEQFGLDNESAVKYKDGLIQKIILDDIAKRYQIDKIKVFHNTFQFISGNLTSTLSLRKITNRLKDQGVEITPTTLDNYIYYWETSYAINKLTKFDYRLSRVFNRTAKYYVIDNIFIPGKEENDEKRLENLVYIELVRRYGRENIFFGQDPNGYEVDFVIKLENEFKFFQICYQLDDKNAKREFGNLTLINKYIKGESIVLYLDDLRKNEATRKREFEGLLEFMEKFMATLTLKNIV